MSATSPAPAPALNPAAAFGPGFLENPYPVYAMLRAANPVFPVPVPADVGAGIFLLTRHADVQHVLRDAAGTFSADRRNADAIQRNRERLSEFFLEGGVLRSMLTMDPPDHTRVRGLVNKAFTPRRIAALRPHIEAITQQLLEENVKDGHMDVMAGLATPLPAIVIAELLGVPPADWPRFRRWADQIVSVTGNMLQSGPDMARMREGLEPMRAYLLDAIAERRRAPREDLLSGLVQAQEDRDALSDEEMIATAMLLLLAGHETTTNLIGNGTLALLRNPAEAERLRADPALAKTAIEEMLRYDSPVQGTVRVAREDVELGGRTIPKGALVVCNIGAANRDPAVFPDPDRFDVARAENPHLSFGFGAHFCLGATLARLEGEVAISALLRRFPGLALDAADVTHRPNPILRGLLALPVRGGA